MKKLLLLFVLLVPFVSGSAKSFLRGEAGGHEADAYSVLPFKECEKISDWLEAVHKTIDVPYNAYFKGLRDAPHQKFSWGKYGHRIFFHWGFNGRPWSPQLEEKVLECHWDAATTDAFKQKLVDEQARRNRFVMEITSETLQLGMSGVLREYTNGFASLVYDTHLLGDYSTKMKAPLQDLNGVIDDIKSALYRKLKGGNVALAINKRLDLTKTLYSDTETRAGKVLEIMHEDVPEMILNAQDGYFRKHFRDCKIKVKSGI
jgi:hypothetical protein